MTLYQWFQTEVEEDISNRPKMLDISNRFKIWDFKSILNVDLWLHSLIGEHTLVTDDNFLSDNDEND